MEQMQEYLMQLAKSSKKLFDLMAEMDEAREKLRHTPEYLLVQAITRELKAQRLVVQAQSFQSTEYVQAKFAEPAPADEASPPAHSSDGPGLVFNDNGVPVPNPDLKKHRFTNGGILESVADQINAGALDSDGVQVTAEFRPTLGLGLSI